MLEESRALPKLPKAEQPSVTTVGRLRRSGSLGCCGQQGLSRPVCNLLVLSSSNLKTSRELGTLEEENGNNQTDCTD
jgi:hypothetical protein